jgi:choline dehydrogenase-like flavoprotein
MLVDFGREGSLPNNVDLIIVGGGISGLALASELMDTSLKVLLIESGGLESTAESRDLARPESVDNRHPAADGMSRVLGTGSTDWDAEAQLQENWAYGPRPWVIEGDWPISSNTLEMYADRGRRILGLDTRTAGLTPWEEDGRLPPEFDARIIALSSSKYTTKSDVSAHLLESLEQSANITIAYNATVVDIRLTEDGKDVDGLVVRNDFGTTLFERARAYAICAGGVDTPRLFLASTSQEDRGIGNSFGMVGKAVHDRTRVVCGVVRPNNKEQFDEAFADWISKTARSTVQMQLAEELVRNEEVLCTAGRFRIKSELGDLSQVKHLVEKIRSKSKPLDIAKSSAKAMKEIPTAASAYYSKIFKKRAFSPDDSEIYLEAWCGQPPANGSSIRLGQERDRFGMPRVILDWRSHEIERKSIAAFAYAVQSQLRKTGLADVELINHVLKSPTGYEQTALPWGHVMGGTRMSLDPSRGVVDPDLRVHGLSNLFISGPSVMPSSGSAHSNLTVVALACRLADELRSLLMSDLNLDFAA